MHVSRVGRGARDRQQVALQEVPGQAGGPASPRVTSRAPVLLFRRLQRKRLAQMGVSFAPMPRVVEGWLLLLVAVRLLPQPVFT